jgi:hypothetical protein
MGGGGTAAGAGGGGFAADPNAMFAALFPLAQGAAEEKLAMSRLARENAKFDLAEKKKKSRGARVSPYATEDPFTKRMKENALARDVAETQAATGRVPTRMSTIGMQTFATPDPLKMTGAQRARFLPGGNTMEGGLAPSDINRSRSDALFQAQMEQDRARQRAGY